MGELMNRISKNLIKVHRSTPVFEAIDLMNRKHIQHLPVVDDFGEILGLLDRSHLEVRAGEDQETGSLMRSPVVYLTNQDSLKLAIQKMVENKVSSLLIRDRSIEKTLGIITYDEILKYVNQALQNDNEKSFSMSDVFEQTKLGDLAKALPAFQS